MLSLPPTYIFHPNSTPFHTHFTHFHHFSNIYPLFPHLPTFATQPPSSPPVPAAPTVPAFRASPLCSMHIQPTHSAPAAVQASPPFSGGCRPRLPPCALEHPLTRPLPPGRRLLVYLVLRRLDVTFDSRPVISLKPPSSVQIMHLA